MQHAQNAYRIPCDAVGSNIRRTLDDQFACAIDASGTAQLRKLHQPFGLIPDTASTAMPA
jgi:hypothetical protein